jgi:hypothetical protein
VNKYGQAALNAVNLIQHKQASTPMDAWQIATSELFGNGTESQKKACPKGAFVGLCEDGLIRGIPKGNYAVRSGLQKNKGYAVKAVELLKENPALGDDKKVLWEAVINGEVMKSNSQLDVVLALWIEGKIL